MEKLNKIDILYNGYSYIQQTDENIMFANCTCTLIRCPAEKTEAAPGQKGSTFNVIVDTMTPWDSDRIKRALVSNPIKLLPDQIQTVVNTHGHSDHIGCNHLFSKAHQLIVGRHISEFDKYFLHDFERQPIYKLSKDIDIISTPGHTLNCVSVMVRNAIMMNIPRNDQVIVNWRPCTVAICGDLFENVDDIMDDQIWINAGSECQRLQKLNRWEMAKRADWIVPGHGSPFKVTHLIREQLKADALDYFQ